MKGGRSLDQNIKEQIKIYLFIRFRLSYNLQLLSKRGIIIRFFELLFREIIISSPCTLKAF